MMSRIISAEFPSNSRWINGVSDISHSAIRGETPMVDVRWSPDLSPNYLPQQIYSIGRVVDPETGEVFVVVRKTRCPAWALSESDWDRLAPVVVFDRDGAA
jgi:hypothetical protein